MPADTILERVVFAEERRPNHHIKVIASGPVDGTLLDALESFVKRQWEWLGNTPITGN